MDESTNIHDSDDLSVSSVEMESPFDDMAEKPDVEERTATDSDETERYWIESTNAYSLALEKGELFETNDDIKEVKGSPEFESFASTRIGGRKENQDTAAFRLTDRGLLLIVCDGMGGGPSGKRASFLAAHVISRFVGQTETDIPDTSLMNDAIQQAHKVLKYDAARHPENFGMGTTAATLLINREHAVIAHVGDSRVYQLRDGRMIFRTTDHSLVARKMQIEGWTDEEARTSDESNIITQAIGHRDIEPEIETRPFLKGDRFLICSDGIWGHYPQRDLLRIICSCHNIGGALADLMVTTDNIGIEEGNRHDNFTGIMLQTNISSKTEDSMTKLSRLCIYLLGIALAISLAFNIIQYISSSKTSEPPTIEETTIPVAQTPIPPSEASTQTAPVKDTEDTAQTTARKDTLYIIRDGDLISKIAIRFNTSTEDIRQANPDIDLNKISIGQTIVIPLNSRKK